MPRKPRMYLAGVPCHVVQRGNNRAACFFTDDDYAFYLEVLADACRRYRVDVNAYVLMTNHVHLVLAPRADGFAISALMRRLALLIPPPRQHSLRYQGLFAPHAKHRAKLAALLPAVADTAVEVVVEPLGDVEERGLPLDHQPGRVDADTVIEELIACEDAPGVGGQVVQEAELRRGEGQAFSVDFHLMLQGVDDKAFALDAFGGAQALTDRTAPQDGLDPQCPSLQNLEFFGFFGRKIFT